MALWQSIYLGFLGLLPKAGAAIFILTASWLLSRLARGAVLRAFALRKTGAGAAPLLASAGYWGVWALGAIMALQQFTDVTAFLTGLGIVGFTVGFALQDVMKNFMAGVLLLAQQPFKVGDAIAVTEIEGTVMSISLRSTELVTFDGRTVTLPNSEVLNHAIVNYSRSLLRRLALRVGVSYQSDLKKVRDVALLAVQNLRGLSAEPVPQVVFEELGDFAINLRLYYWVDTAQTSLLSAQDEALTLLTQAFAANGIEIPSPLVATRQAKKE